MVKEINLSLRGRRFDSHCSPSGVCLLWCWVECRGHISRCVTMINNSLFFNLKCVFTPVVTETTGSVSGLSITSELNDELNDLIQRFHNQLHDSQVRRRLALAFGNYFKTYVYRELIQEVKFIFFIIFYCVDQSSTR